MEIITKAVKGFEIYPQNKEYIERRFCKFSKMVKEPAILEFTFDHTHGTRANIDKKIILNFTMPGLTKAEHLEEISEHFTESIDKLQKRFEKFLSRKREKDIKSSRYPKKYYAAKIEERASGEI
ncbi:MAG: hypothetical protein M1338_02555 [Patescibacteria group bacterium]|nr:hypothetical protein [Patescibacteria group bacterium]